MKRSRYTIAAIQEAYRYPDFSKVSRTHDIEQLEDAWIGGVGDFGDPRAAEVIQQAPGYHEYFSDVEDILRKKLGDKFTVYRSMSADAYDTWKQGGDVGYVSVTTTLKVAKSWKNFAHNRGKDMIVVSFSITPEMVIMVGHPAEDELVIDGNEVSFHQVKRIR